MSHILAQKQLRSIILSVSEIHCCPVSSWFEPVLNATSLLLHPART